jgi:hypothetical protein
VNWGGYRYVRVKRYQQTFCFLCDPKETVRSIKERIATILLQQHIQEKAEAASSSSSFHNSNSSHQLDDFRIVHTDQSSVLLDTDTLQYVHSISSNKSSTSAEGDTTPSNLTKVPNPNDTSPSLLLYLICPLADHEWETIDVVSTEIE